MESKRVTKGALTKAVKLLRSGKMGSTPFCNSCKRDHLFIEWEDNKGFLETVGAHMSSMQREVDLLYSIVTGLLMENK